MHHNPPARSGQRNLLHILLGNFSPCQDYLKALFTSTFKVLKVAQIDSIHAPQAHHDNVGVLVDVPAANVNQRVVCAKNLRVIRNAQLMNERCCDHLSTHRSTDKACELIVQAEIPNHLATISCASNDLAWSASLFMLGQVTKPAHRLPQSKGVFRSNDLYRLTQQDVRQLRNRRRSFVTQVCHTDQRSRRFRRDRA